MDDPATAIVFDLQTVMRERELRTVDADLGLAVAAVKAYQHQRFAQTYADLLAQPKYAAATRFFLDDLYGPADYNERDRQFMRIVPAMVRLFSTEIVSTVRLLGGLHALSEQLDTAMARSLSGLPISEVGYGQAWRKTSAVEREQQIASMLRIGSDLDRYTRKPLLRQSLRLMRSPAQAAGLGELQRFLETGFNTFREMRGSAEFLSIIGKRERALAAALYAAEPAGRNFGNPI